jgi:phosphatidylinositol glycan class Q protein
VGYSGFIASARIYDWQLSILISLFHLFRGKKRNVLRDRIDSCDYDLDQLLLGTIMFTLLAFLFPTVMVFYFAFAIARAGVLVGKVILDIGLACLNHWPLFALMLRVKDPARIPGPSPLADSSKVAFDLDSLTPLSRLSRPRHIYL